MDFDPTLAVVSRRIEASAKRRNYQFEPLEPRLLLSADPLGSAAQVLHNGLDELEDWAQQLETLNLSPDVLAELNPALSRLADDDGAISSRLVEPLSGYLQSEAEQSTIDGALLVLGQTLDEIRDLYDRGQPVLVGTASIETSELLSGVLRKKKLHHEVLNAKQHAREAEIVAQAGRPGAITIATNMAGRGTDIILGGNPEELAKGEVEKLEIDEPEDIALAEFYIRMLRKRRRRREADV